MNFHNQIQNSMCSKKNTTENHGISWFLAQGAVSTTQNLLVTDASKRILTATLLGCTSRVIMKSIPNKERFSDSEST